MQPKKRPRKYKMADIEGLDEFVSECQRRIAAIHDDQSYRLVTMWVSGAPEWSRLPDGVVDDITHHLETKRQEVVRKTFIMGAG